eukprot:2180500-Prymnesium_polylepis.1
MPRHTACFVGGTRALRASAGALRAAWAALLRRGGRQRRRCGSGRGAHLGGRHPTAWRGAATRVPGRDASRGHATGARGGRARPVPHV